MSIMSPQTQEEVLQIPKKKPLSGFQLGVLLALGLVMFVGGFLGSVVSSPLTPGLYIGMLLWCLGLCELGYTGYIFIMRNTKVGAADYENRRGNALFALKRYEEALAAFDQAIFLAPRKAVYRNRRALALFNLKLLEERGPAAWKVGDLIDHQSEVRGILGEGGMGTVFKVYYRPWNREVAVKCPRPEIFARADGKAHFIQEAETWTALGAYPHIVQGHFVRVVNGIPHVFAEYVQGGNLADWIEQRRLYAGGPEQALERILDLAIQFAWGLHFAHERGLVHQDVKPANVMVTVDGTAKVTDFGLAKARLLAGESTITVGSGQQSMLVSSRGMTPAYCSPEQAAGRPLNRKSDIWSWGLAVLEMFVGEVTWKVGVVAREALASYQGEDPARPVMPAAVIDLLKDCFQQEPEARPATMLEVATELGEIYAHCMGRPYPRVMPRPTEIQVDFLLNRGVSLRELGRREEALASYEQALRLDPNNAHAHNNRGNVLRKLGRRKEALASYEQALRLDPNSVHAHSNRGLVLRELGRREEALVSLDHALHLNPSFANAHLNRALVLRELGRLEEAKQASQEARSLQSQN